MSTIENTKLAKQQCVNGLFVERKTQILQEYEVGELIKKVLTGIKIHLNYQEQLLSKEQNLAYEVIGNSNAKPALLNIEFRALIDSLQMTKDNYISILPAKQSEVINMATKQSVGVSTKDGVFTYKLHNHEGSVDTNLFASLLNNIDSLNIKSTAHAEQAIKQLSDTLKEVANHKQHLQDLLLDNVDQALSAVVEQMECYATAVKNMDTHPETAAQLPCIIQLAHDCGGVINQPHDTL